jgi:hypothetical protein
MGVVMCRRTAQQILWMGLALVVALVACGAGPSTPSQPAYASAQSPAQGSPAYEATAKPAATCPPTAQIGGLAERQGVAGDGATLWALFFPTEPMLTVGQEIKVVWRMTGSGDFSIVAAGPGATTIKPVWGPEPHLSSTWNRPGDEWGTGWVFPAAGCWTISASRSNNSGYLVVRVAG